VYVPFGASGSSRINATAFVSSGKFSKVSGGETPSLPQVKRGGNALPLLNAGLSTVNVATSVIGKRIEFLEVTCEFFFAHPNGRMLARIRKRTTEKFITGFFIIYTS
jgi:hypothetical protein